ncbi:hypothetical protein [Deinococcus roseus]|uniref:Uncharacterized protein n=1 Tax=Deinococcus roseus TaxID=392414 RepID=A0ABQ2CYN6_9DEIO|nr:hypothetical protein [Deinococcus roseus]GGJ33774.1 hypothetical protein GCM10008938_20040 [Deinococcus roseus]
MSFLDNLAKGLKNALDVAKTKGEEAAQYSKARYELFQLNRDLDATYNKLGKQVFNSNTLEGTGEFFAEVRRLQAEIAQKEEDLREIGQKNPEAAEEAEAAIQAEAASQEASYTPPGTAAADSGTQNPGPVNTTKSDE